MKCKAIKIILAMMSVTILFGLGYNVSAEDMLEEPKTEEANTQIKKTKILYSTHIQKIGWQAEKSNGELSGTSGKSLRLEAIKIRLEDQEYTGDIEYSTHVQKIGWQASKKNGELSGTSGKSLRLEAIKINLTGELAEHYDIYYRVHIQKLGWLDWGKNGEKVGSSGYSYRLEGIEIKLTEKNGAAPGKIDNHYIQRYLSYSTHIQNIGWQGIKYDGKTSGTSGKKLRLEAIKINLEDQEYAGDIEYNTYVQNIGWQTSKKNGELSGTSGKKLRLEAIKINLTGEIAEHYDVYYRVHVQGFGWLGWAKNGAMSGTTGYSYRLEGIEIKLVKKGEGNFTNITDSYKNNPIRYQTHIQNIGWQKQVFNGQISGTTGRKLRVEGIKIENTSPYQGNVVYRTYDKNIGWGEWKNNGQTSGTTGKSLPIEAIQIKLEGEMLEKYDIYYSTHVSDKGWLGWAKNGETAGISNLYKQIEAIKIVVVPKNQNFNENMGTPYYEAGNIIYQSVIQGKIWQNYTNKISGTIGQSKKLVGIAIKNPEEQKILYSVKPKNKNWQEYVSDGELAGDQTNIIEAIKIKLENSLADKYDVYYRVHLPVVGWTGWTKNDEKAGSIDLNSGIEAYEIKLAPKEINIKTSTAFYKQYIPTYFGQTDHRWANKKYGLGTMRNSGCAPTAMAMAFSGVLNKSILPTQIADYLYYKTSEFNKRVSGTGGMGIKYAAGKYNVKLTGINSLSKLKQELAKGKIIFAAMGNGRYATSKWNHAIIMYKYSNGNTYVYDPLTTLKNGWVSTSLIWNQRSRDPDDLRGGYALYALG